MKAICIRMVVNSGENGMKDNTYLYTLSCLKRVCVGGIRLCKTNEKMVLIY